MLKYRALYERYRSLIEGGAYEAGERLPSLRSVAEAEGLGLNTVRSAFGLLDDEGLAAPLERGGYYVRSRAGGASSGRLEAYSAPSSCTEAEGLSAFRKIEYLLASGGSRAGLALAEPDAELLPVARLGRLYASLKGSWIDYGDQSGEEELRRRITSTYHPYHRSLSPGEVLVTNGATEAIGLALRAFVEPGDLVAVESPTYYDYFRQIAAARARVVEIPLRGGGMDLDLLAKRLKRGGIKMVIAQPNVQNPTGTIMPDADKARLVRLAARSGAYLVQDDVYGDLAFSASRPAALSALADYERLVYLSSFSKCLAPGLRIGWMHAPGLMPELARAKGLASLSTNRPTQRVVASYLAGRAFRAHLAAMRETLRAQLEDYLEVLAGGLPEGSSFLRPAGGCLLWIALPIGTDASALFERAAREGLLFAPGELFSANPFFRSHLRINFGYRLAQKRRDELGRLCALARGAAARGSPRSGAARRV
jgi:Transcriptional regulators containing a DNA-binding HTH domain and an aminotransferase domain (MocR family) and their eukaryotic orthologs